MEDGSGVNQNTSHGVLLEGLEFFDKLSIF